MRSTSDLPGFPSPAAERDRSETLGGMVLAAARRGADVALRFPLDGQTASLSYGELGVISREIARGLIALGIDPGDRVAILCSTRAEWTLADCGALCAGAVVVPVYHTNSPEECAYVLKHSEARVVFCEDPSQAAKIEQVRERLPRLRQIVLIEGEASHDAITIEPLRERGAEVPQDAVGDRADAVSPEDPATLVYTSGTTGPPK